MHWIPFWWNNKFSLSCLFVRWRTNTICIGSRTSQLCNLVLLQHQPHQQQQKLIEHSIIEDDAFLSESFCNSNSCAYRIQNISREQQVEREWIMKKIAWGQPKRKRNRVGIEWINERASERPNDRMNEWMYGVNGYWQNNEQRHNTSGTAVSLPLKRTIYFRSIIIIPYMQNLNCSLCMCCVCECMPR